MTAIDNVNTSLALDAGRQALVSRPGHLAARRATAS
mgnify:CR=1 FL=1